MTNTSGNLLIAFHYDAYGTAVYTTHDSTLAPILAQVNPLGYRGYVMDSGTGLYYLQSRYYDTAWGRFINADGLVSTGQGLLGNNMFAYCLNNPVMLSDPTGMSSHYAAPWLCDCSSCNTSTEIAYHYYGDNVVYDESTLPTDVIKYFYGDGITFNDSNQNQDTYIIYGNNPTINNNTNITNIENNDGNIGIGDNNTFIEGDVNNSTNPNKASAWDISKVAGAMSIALTVTGAIITVVGLFLGISFAWPVAIIGIVTAVLDVISYATEE